MRKIVVTALVASLLTLPSAAHAANPPTKCLTGKIVRGSGGTPESLPYYRLRYESTYSLEAKALSVPLKKLLRDNGAKKKDARKRLNAGTVICGASWRKW